MIEILQSHIVCDNCDKAESTGVTTLERNTFDWILAKFAQRDWVSNSDFDFCSEECKEEFYKARKNFAESMNANNANN